MPNVKLKYPFDSSLYIGDIGSYKCFIKPHEDEYDVDLLSVGKTPGDVLETSLHTITTHTDPVEGLFWKDFYNLLKLKTTYRIPIEEYQEWELKLLANFKNT